MTPPPKVSFLVPVYNPGRYLAEALESLLAQTFADFELIAVDDGSTDGSLAVLRRFAQRDARVIVLSRPNTGIVGALNDGLAVARGEYIARMDADDVAAPERLAVQLAYLDAHPEIVAAGSSVVMVDTQGRALKDFKAQTDPRLIRERLVAATDIGIIHPTLVVRRAVLERVGGYRPAYQLVEDFDLFLRLLDEGELGNVPEPLLDYRQHPASTNFTRYRTQHELMDRCLAEHRQRWNLPPLDRPLTHPPVQGKGAQQILWAYWAMEGGHPRTALRHALAGCVQSGLAREARQCLNYVLSFLCRR